jgi:hypothetical protein
MKDFITKLYILGFMALTVLFMMVIWKQTFFHIFEEYHARQEALEIQKMREEIVKEKDKSIFQKIILEGEETVKYYLGYRVLEEKRIKGHFHHIDFEIGPDARSHCVICHGDMPHDDVKELRAFLNMHAFFVACQTCHIRRDAPEAIRIFKWYDRTTGELVKSPVNTTKSGTYTAKIIPFEYVGGEIQRIDSQDKIDFAVEFRENEEDLSNAQKSRAKKMIHEQVGQKPYICEDCHQTENPLLPLESLGYTKERANAIKSTEVAGMIKKYTDFYMPRMLHPGERKKKLLTE